MSGLRDPYRAAAALDLAARARTHMPRRSLRHGRVVHVSSALFGPDGITGGGERYAYALARSVAELVPTTLVTFGSERRSERDGELRIEVYPDVGGPGTQDFDPLGYRFLEHLRRADVVHVNHYRIAVSQLAILAAAAMGLRAFATDHGGVGVHFDPRVRVERHLTALLACSRFSLASLPAAVPARVIYGGANARFLAAEPAPRCGGDPLPERVLFVGRIMRHKGIDVLLRGLPAGVGLDVVGRVYDEPFLQLLHSLADGRDVRFIHDADDEYLIDAYRNALVTVLPSVYEDAFGGHWDTPELLGGVLLESMACGTPVICSDVGGMPEIVTDGATGFVVAPNDAEAIAERIRRLASNPAGARAMGESARESVLERFTWEHVARTVVEAYARDWSA